MSYDLDLRSPEYVNREIIHKKRPFITILLIALFISPAFIYYGLNHYHQLLVDQAAQLENEVIILRGKAEPFLIMTSELESIEARKQIIDRLKPAQKKWSASLNLLHDTAPQQINITGIEVKPCGSTKISGTSLNMYAPASYRQDLSGLPAFGQTELDIMTLNSDKNYTFTMTTQLLTGDEPDDSTE